MKAIIALILAISVASQSMLADGTESLASSYRKALEAQDVEAFLALFEFAPDTPDFVRNQTLESFQMQSKLKIKEIAFLPLDAEMPPTFELKGVTYGPTLEPKMRMTVSFDEAGQGKAKFTSVTFVIGEKNGALRMVRSKPIK